MQMMLSIESEYIQNQSGVRGQSNTEVGGWTWDNWKVNSQSWRDKSRFKILTRGRGTMVLRKCMIRMITKEVAHNDTP